VLRLLASAVGESNNREARDPVLEMRLHFDAASLETDERMRDGAREHLTHARLARLACL
jgi:hypothetical protein